MMRNCSHVQATSQVWLPNHDCNTFCVGVTSPFLWRLESALHAEFVVSMHALRALLQGLYRCSGPTSPTCKTEAQQLALAFALLCTGACCPGLGPGCCHPVCATGQCTDAGCGLQRAGAPCSTWEHLVQGSSMTCIAVSGAARSLSHRALTAFASGPPSLRKSHAWQHSTCLQRGSCVRCFAVQPRAANPTTLTADGAPHTMYHCRDHASVQVLRRMRAGNAGALAM